MLPKGHTAAFASWHEPYTFTTKRINNGRYAYREDVWEAMDYELGTTKVFYKYWDYQEANALHLHFDEVYSRVKDKTLWKFIQREFE